MQQSTPIEPTEGGTSIVVNPDKKTLCTRSNLQDSQPRHGIVMLLPENLRRLESRLEKSMVEGARGSRAKRALLQDLTQVQEALSLLKDDRFDSIDAQSESGFDSSEWLSSRPRGDMGLSPDQKRRRCHACGRPF
jgi:hypothetical protein